MELSIVTTMYRSAAYIEEFHRRVTQTARQVATDYELVLVNDGSPDASLSTALALAETDPHVVVVDLSRNFGHHQAVMAGLAQARGRRVFVIDIDLEEQPEWLATFWTALDETGADVIFGVQQQREGSFFRRLSGALFYKLFNLMSETRIPANACSVRLMSRTYVDALLTVQDKNLFLAANFAWAGFDQRGLAVRKQVRSSGSTYTLFKRARLLLNAVTSFTSYPLHAVFAVGALISLAAAVFTTTVVTAKLLYPDSISLGWPSLIGSIWLLGGLTIGSIGLIGLYLSRIFVECKDRPPYIVRRVYRAAPVAATPAESNGKPRGPLPSSESEATGHTSQACSNHDASR